MKQDIVAAMRAGVNNYVTKPFDPKTIKEKIDSAGEFQRQNLLTGTKRSTGRKDRRFCRIDPIRVRTGGRYLYSAG